MTLNMEWLSKFFITHCLCVPSLFLFGQSDNSLLWKVSSSNHQHVSYLFGSIHTNDSLLNTFSDSWWEAFLSCNMLVGEVNATDQTEMAASITSALMQDKSLSDLYTPDEMDRVRNYLMQNMDSRSAMLVGKMKPFYILAALMEAPGTEGPYDQVMDIRLQRIAVGNNMKVEGLESTKEQAASIDAIPLNEQAKMLLEYIDAQDPEKLKSMPDELQSMEVEMRKLESFYLQQNLDSLSSLLMAMEDMAPEMFVETLLDSRNDRFMKKLLPLIQTNEVFCVVGAMHLTGTSGLIAALRREGYRIEPVQFSFTSSKLERKE
jgi:uncharacterized protein YbaP (TraB family)